MKNIKNFQKIVLACWRENGRHTLPWRTTSDPYKILVSEIMLQQTQVERVVPYFERWMRKFPTIESLASSSLASVLQSWSGLGYNRRAKLLRECAKEIVEKHGGTIPKGRPALESLPAIGPYTAGAIRVFAFNKSDVPIETNIRSVYIHHFFPHTITSDGRHTLSYVDDRDIRVLAEKAARGQDPRTWHAALMDYGAYIKKTYPNPSRRCKHHTRQSPFEGSLRQCRGIILRRLLKGPIAHKALLKVDTKQSYFLELALRDLEREGLIEKKKGKWWIA